MLVKPLSYPVQALDVVHASKLNAGSGADAAITLAATTGRRWVLHNVQWSYSGTPTGGKLTITGLKSGANWEVDIIAGGPGGFGLVLPGADGGAITITLLGVVSNTGKLNVQAVLEAA